MPWNGKTTRKDRKRRAKERKKNDRYWRWLVGKLKPRTYARTFKDLGIKAPLPPQPQFVIELFNLDGFEK